MCPARTNSGGSCSDAGSPDNVWDDESWCALSARLVEQSRQAGALRVLPVALLLALTIQLVTGEFAVAGGMAEEAGAVAQATGNPAGPYGPLLPAAWTGQQARPTS